MFGNDRLLQLFADQFKADGPDFLYRRNLRQSAIRVTAAERQAFIADFARCLPRLSWVLILVTVVGIVGLVTYESVFDAEDQQYLNYGVIAVAFAAYMTAYRHYWNAPWRALRTRAVIGEGLSRRQVRAITLSKISWSSLAVSALGVTVLLVSLASSNDLTVGWNRLWLVAAGVMYALLAFRAYQKLQLGITQGATPESAEQMPELGPRPSWLRIAGGALAGLAACHLFGGVGAEFVAGSFKLVSGSAFGLAALSHSGWIVWLALYAVWLVSAGVGQAAGAVTARWIEAVWIVAGFNAAFFFAFYLILGKSPYLLMPVLLPFVIAYFIRRSPMIRRRIAARQSIFSLAYR
jgi:hypothetical protein